MKSNTMDVTSNCAVFKLCVVLSLICFIYSQVLSQQPVPPAHTDNRTFNAELQMLIEAAHDNPRHKAADARVAASSSSVRIQKSLEPPLLGVEFYQAPVASFPNPFKDQMEYDYSIQQMLPFPGKLGSMAGAEQKRTEMLKAERQTVEQDIVQKVRKAYYELYLLDRRMEINSQTRELVRGFVDIARKQYELGMGKQSDVLRAQTELLSIVNDSITLIQQRKSMEGMLNALCNRPVTTGIGFVPEIDPVLTDYDLSSLLAAAEKNRPELISMQAGVEMRRAELSAARKEYLPDFMVRGTYKQMMQGDDYWSVMAGVTIPIAPWSFGKYSSGTARSDANIREAQAELENMKNMIAAEINDALLKVASGEERLKLSRETAIPQAQKALESAMTAYKTGKQEFLMLVDIQRMLVTARLDYHMATMNLLDSKAQLERAAGINPDEIDEATERGNR